MPMKAKKVENGWFVRLDKGEEVMSTLVAFISEKQIPAGTISGIGALTEVELGYFNRDRAEYQRRRFTGVYELLSLAGNIAYVGGKPMVHAHCLLGDADYQVCGGHLFEGTVAVTGEIYIQVFAEKFERKMNPEIKLNLLDV
jgi:predicted DNA-binding protein with PD1-like motif